VKLEKSTPESFKGVNDDEPLPMDISILKKRMKTVLYVEIFPDIGV
jgi:hypothetical protein